MIMSSKMGRKNMVIGVRIEALELDALELDALELVALELQMPGR